MKRFLKIIGVIVLLFLAALIAIPFVLESKIEAIVQNYADKNLNANLSFDSVSLSLISSFPKAEVNIENLKITTLKPFDGETLVTAKRIAFELPMTDVFKSNNTQLVINDVIADELLLVLKTNTTGAVNYDIVKPSHSDTNTESSETSEASTFSFDVKNYQVNNSALTYIDESSKTTVYITEFKHSGKGVFSAETSEIDTYTKANISFSKDDIAYLTNNSIELAAVIDLDLEKNTYTFKDNTATINALPLEFNGYVQLQETGQHIDIAFKNPGSSFKEALALIPATYSKSLDGVSTTGNFTVTGKVKGLYSETSIPTFAINMDAKNASFKYPNLPKQVDNITINVGITNTTGKPEDTFIDINNLNFKIDEDVFKLEAHLKNVTTNMLVNANLDGVLNLANISKAYPIDLEHQLTGVLNTKLNTVFDMEALETNAYTRIKNTGKVSVANVVFSSEDFLNPFQINIADLSFKPGLVTLNTFEALTGKSDFTATGTLKNVLGFLLSDKKLQGDFNVNANTFTISDFMVEDQTNSKTTTETKTASNPETLKIPDFLDCNISANANTVVYDNLILKNVNGQLRIKDQQAELTNMTTDLFGGKIKVSGTVSTQNKTPSFNMQLGMDQLDVAESFKNIQVLKALAPIAKVIQGKLNATLTLDGLLDEDFAPDLTSISGTALAALLNNTVNANQSAILTGLNNTFNFIDFNKLDLKDLKTNLTFKNGNVTVKPFTINYKDIPIKISGTHNLSNIMNYNAVLQIPASYLGSDVNRLIGSIGDNSLENLKVPVTAIIGGNFTNPNITTDLSQSITNVTKELVAIQKEKLVNKGKDKVTNLLGGLLGGNTKEDTTSTSTSETKTDSTKTSKKDTVKEGVKTILGGLLGGTKQTKPTKEKDTLLYK